MIDINTTSLVVPTPPFSPPTPAAPLPIPSTPAAFPLPQNPLTYPIPPVFFCCLKACPSIHIPLIGECILHLLFLHLPIHPLINSIHQSVLILIRIIDPQGNLLRIIFLCWMGEVSKSIPFSKQKGSISTEYVKNHFFSIQGFETL